MRTTPQLAVLVLLSLCATAHADGPDVEVAAAGRAHTLNEQVERATKALGDASGRNAALAHAIRALAAYRQGRFRSAVYDFGKARKGPLSVDDALLLFEGESQFHDGNYASARRKYEKLIKDFDHSPWRHRAIVRLADCDIAEGKWSKAIRGLSKALDKYPEFPHRAAAFYAVAVAERARGKLSRSGRWLRRILRSYPSDPIAENAKRDLAALAAQGIEPDKESPDERYRRAYDLRRRKYFRQAIEVFDRLMVEDGVSRGIKAKAAYQRGRALYQMERFEEARAGFEALEETRSWRRLARVWKSRALARLGRLDDAANTLLSAVTSSGRRSRR